MEREEKWVMQWGQIWRCPWPSINAITGTILGIIFGAASGTLFYNTLFTPNIISSQPDIDQNGDVLIKITNNGSAPAKNALIIVKSKEAFTKDPVIFATNNYSLNTNFTKNPDLVKLSVPRFSQGEGSFIQLTISLNNKPGLSVYTTYDEGRFWTLLTHIKIHAFYLRSWWLLR
jgi:hypothetical protein